MERFMASERSWAVVVACDELRVAGQLWARFAPEGEVSEMTLLVATPYAEILRSKGVKLGVVRTLNTLAHELLYNVLEPLGPTGGLEFVHAVVVMAEGSAHTAVIVERLSCDRVRAPDDPYGLDIEFRLSLRVKGLETTIGEGIWPSGALLDAFSKAGVLACCCATCEFSQVPPYGGEDERDGLYCLRDVPGPRSLKHEAEPSALMAAGAWSCVSAYHYCPWHRPKSAFEKNPGLAKE